MKCWAAELDPYESTNIDLSVEKYIGESGILSLGVFHKSIDGYIVQVRQAGADGIYDGLPVVTSVNGDKAKVRGAEFNWQQQLSFLPAGWDGLLVGASGTGWTLISTRAWPSAPVRTSPCRAPRRTCTARTSAMRSTA